MKRLLFVSRRSRRIVQPSEGFTLIEALVTIAIIGVLAALVGPGLFAVNKPLQNATNQVSGIFKQVRLRAIATTTAYRVRPNPTNNRALIVEASNTRGCGSTTQLTDAAVSTDRTLKVTSVRGFFVGDLLEIGSDSTNNNVVAIDPPNSRITIGNDLDTAQAVGARVQLANNWRSGDLITSFTTDDLTLPGPQTGAFRGNPDQEVRVSAAAPNWLLCFDSRGVASQFDPTNGNVLPNDLVLTLRRFDIPSNTAVGGTTTVTIFRGGGVSIAANGNPSPPAVINE